MKTGISAVIFSTGQAELLPRDSGAARARSAGPSKPTRDHHVRYPGRQRRIETRPLDHEQVQRAYACGMALSLDQVIDLALEAMLPGP